jgi:hypothetical protein
MKLRFIPTLLVALGLSASLGPATAQEHQHGGDFCGCRPSCKSPSNPLVV